MSGELSNLKIDRAMKDTGERPHRKWVWAVVVLLLIIVIAFLFSRRGQAVEVQTFRVEPSSVRGEGIVLNATGYIIAAHKIELAPKVVGRVQWVGVERADKVKAGQELVRLESDEYRARALQAMGQLDAAKARLDELKNGSRPEEIAKSKAELDGAVADMEAAKARVERNRQAAEANAISQIDLEEAMFRHKAQEARVASLQQSYELMKQGPRKEQIAAQQALVEQATGMLQLAEVDLSNTVIKAPVDGTILARNVEVGEYVTTGFVGEGGAKGYVVSMADLGDLRVELDIGQEDFAKVSRDQKCQVTTDAYPDRKYEGEVDLISPEANRQKATVQVRVKILKPDELLRPDMNASVAFLSSGNESTAGALAIPASAVKDNAVFVVEQDKVVRKPVELGGAVSGGMAVKSGVAAGDEIVVNPPDALKDGSAIRRQEKK